MALSKFIIPPDQASYAVTDGKEVVYTQLDGGAGRFRRDILGATSRVVVQWTCNREKYKYVRSFYRGVTVSGSLPFEIDLYLDDPFELTTHKAYFVPETMKLASQQGLQFVVTAELEVYSAEDEDGGYYALFYNEFGEDNSKWQLIVDFDTLINVDIPLDVA